jgi:hypothetical protein
MAGKCKKKKKHAKFCATRGCSENNYQKCCEPAKGKWKCGAHHIVCVSSVGRGLMSNPDVRRIVRDTEWCINAEINMIGLPIWGATVKYYCRITKAGGSFLNRANAPAFKNLPQHDWDHNIANGYTDEITGQLYGMADDILDRDHNNNSQNIAGQLNSFSEHYRVELMDRGTGRKGGTHKAWWTAIDSDGDPGTKWYLPFSMAEESIARERPFPLKKASRNTAEWIDRIAHILSGR